MVVMVVAANPLLPRNVVKLEGPFPCDTVKHNAINLKFKYLDRRDYLDSFMY